MIPLPLITSLARAGALEQAWRLFREGGYDQRGGDPAALAVKGRLLKDSALRGGVREKFGLAAQAYAAAHDIDPQPYLLINVATLNLLGGAGAQAETAARAVLARLDAPAPIAETPYWLGATRAEALLILGRVEAAQAALAAAQSTDPDNWPDHASTLRQLALILAKQGADAHWLDAHRPPKSLHFAGHLGVAETGSIALREQIDTVLAEARIGFGYGALAAGADIVIAEALIAHGAALHIILPTRRADFIAQSVAPFGLEWLARFGACVDAATSISEATSVTGAYEPLATALAADLAMGAALLNARQLESHALQLLVIDDGDGPFGEGMSTARDGEIWQTTGNSQRIITWPRNAPVAASSGKKEGHPDRQLRALLHIRLDGIDALDEGAFASANDRIATPFWSRVDDLIGQPIRVQAQGNGRLVGFEDVGAATLYAQRLHMLDPPGDFPLTIAGHYGLVHATANGVAGFALYVLDRIAAASFPGATTVSETFAMALALSTPGATHAELLGEAEGLRLFGLQ